MKFWCLLILLICASLASSESLKKRCKRLKSEKKSKVAHQLFCSWYKARLGSENEPPVEKLFQPKVYGEYKFEKGPSAERKMVVKYPVSKKHLNSNYELHWNNAQKRNPLAIPTHINKSVSDWIRKIGKKNCKKVSKHRPAHLENELVEEDNLHKKLHSKRTKRSLSDEEVTEYQINLQDERLKLDHELKEHGKIFKRSVDIPEEIEKDDEKNIYFNFTAPEFNLWDVIFNPGKYWINPVEENKFNFTILEHDSNGTETEMTSNAEESHDDIWEEITWSPELIDAPELETKRTSNTEENPDDVWEEITWAPELTDAPELETKRTSNTEENPDDVWEEITWLPELTDAPELESHKALTSFTKEQLDDEDLETTTALNSGENVSDTKKDYPEDEWDEMIWSTEEVKTSTVGTTVKTNSPSFEITERTETSSSRREMTSKSTTPITKVPVVIPRKTKPTIRSTFTPKTTGGKRQYFRVGSIRGIPGKDFPNYQDIPFTSFSCTNKNIPGYYADMETSCQVFHVCFQNRKASFLCPVGTIFNQALMTCDYWYSSNCSLTNHYATLRPVTEKESQLKKTDSKLVVSTATTHELNGKNSSTSVLTNLKSVSRFLPIKAKVTIYPPSGDKRPKVVAFTSVGDKRQTRKNGRQRVTEIQKKSKANPTATTQKGIDPKVNQIIKDAFEIARQVLGEVGSLFPRRQTTKLTTVSPRRPTASQVRKSNYSGERSRALPTLNPRFIVRPVDTKISKSRQELFKAFLDDRFNIRRS